MQVKGSLKIKVKEGWKEVPEYHRWVAKVGVTDYPVTLSLHASPFNPDALAISEVITGCNTGAVVLSPRNHQPIRISDLRKGRRLYVPGHEVRKAARSAAYGLIQRVGAEAFLRAVAMAAVDPVLQEEMAKKPTEEQV